MAEIKRVQSPYEKYLLDEHERQLGEECELEPWEQEQAKRLGNTLVERLHAAERVERELREALEAESSRRQCRFPLIEAALSPSEETERG